MRANPHTGLRALYVEKTAFCQAVFLWRMVKEIEEPVERAAGDVNLDGLFGGLERDGVLDVGRFDNDRCRTSAVMQFDVEQGRCITPRAHDNATYHIAALEHEEVPFSADRIVGANRLMDPNGSFEEKLEPSGLLSQHWAFLDPCTEFPLINILAYIYKIVNILYTGRDEKIPSNHAVP